MNSCAQDAICMMLGVHGQYIFAMTPAQDLKANRLGYRDRPGISGSMDKKLILVH